VHFRDYCRAAVYVCSGLLCPPALSAQEVASADASTANQSHVLPAGAEVHLHLLESVASNTHQHGDLFRLEVVDPVLVDDAIVIPAGAAAEGEVIHAAKAGFGGRGGELILVSRFLRTGDTTVRLRSFSAGSGENRVNLAMGLSYVLVGLFVTGKEITLPAGTDVYAKVAADTPVFPVLIPESGAVTSTLPSIPDQASTEIDNNDDTQQ
jgi:hypothetical protein